ncbi:Uncharacterized protein PHSC3_001304 [Chlamydiales bacterium STE3]|nr:Uncharacterized protein PHSC3_001304 [Chlamydiales bacterium STE3]
MDLTKGPITAHVKEIAIPASLGFFFSTMFNVVDTYFAGWISTEALAALAISFPVFFLVIAFVHGISTGSSALISNSLGAKDEKTAERLTAQVLTFAFFTYLLITPIGLLSSSFLFQVLGASDEFLEMSVAYMNIIFIGSFFLIMLYAANSALLARGNSVVLKNYLIGTFFLNIILNPWFLYGGLGIPPLGIRGIALATVVAMGIGFFYVMYKVWYAGFLRLARPKDFIPNGRVFLEIAKQSLPASLNMMTIGIGIFVITYFIKDFGKAAIAAYGIGTRIEQIAILPTIGLTIASLAIIGQNNGAGLIGRIEETLRITLRYGIYIVLVGCISMYLFSDKLFQIFSQDQQVIEIGAKYLRIAALTESAYVILGISISGLQGMKLPFYALWLGLLRQIIFPISVFYLVTRVLHYGLESVWWSIFFITWTAALVTLWYIQKVIKEKSKNSGLIL